MGRDNDGVFGSGGIGRRGPDGIMKKELCSSDGVLSFKGLIDTKEGRKRRCHCVTEYLFVHDQWLFRIPNASTSPEVHVDLVSSR